jgi:hypothetical protein
MCFALRGGSVREDRRRLEAELDVFRRYELLELSATAASAVRARDPPVRRQQVRVVEPYRDSLDLAQNCRRENYKAVRTCRTCPRRA